MASVIARFETTEALVAAARAARAAGHGDVEAYAPFAVPGLAEALGFRERWIPVVALCAGVLVAAGVLFMQWYAAVVSYPFVVGGKPLASWPAFMLITFETSILAAVLAGIATMLIGNRLPQPYHPAFDWPVFDRASGDGFFLLITADDAVELHAFFGDLQAVEIMELRA